VYVRAHPGTDRGRQVSRDGGREPVWSADGWTLFYRNGNRMMEAEIAMKPPFRSGRRAKSGTGRIFLRNSMITNYDVAADGRFLMLRTPNEPTATGTKVNVILNWWKELAGSRPC
jgi:hypothetical protein